MEKQNGKDHSKLYWAISIAVIAIAFLVVFRSQISSLIDRSGSIDEVEIGKVLKIRLSERAQEIAQPDPRIAKILSTLKPEEIDLLLSHGEENYRPICKGSGIAPGKQGSTTAIKARIYEHFTAVGLVDLKPNPGPKETTDSCLPGNDFRASLTEDGKSVRRYLVTLLSNAVSISAA